MKVAVVGGGVSGCASIHYLDRLHKSRKKNSSKSRASSLRITLFEQADRLGGSKVFSVPVPGYDRLYAELGRISAINIEGPFFKDVISSLSVKMQKEGGPAKKPFETYLTVSRGMHDMLIRTSGVYHYEDKRYHNSFSGSLVLALIQRYLVPTSWIHSLFWRFVFLFLAFKVFMLAREAEREEWILFIALFQLSGILLGIGILGLRLSIDYFHRKYALFKWIVFSRFNYSQSPSRVGDSVASLTEHSNTVFNHESETNSATLVHLLTRCALGSLTIKSMSEFFEYGVDLFPAYVKECILPAMRCEYVLPHVDIRTMNAFASRWAFTQLDPVASRDFNGRLRDGLSAVVEAMARPAELKLKHRVSAIRFIPESEKYRLEYTNLESGETSSEMFDAVILAAVPNLCRLEVQVENIDASLLCGFTERSVSLTERQVDADIPNGFVALVVGKLNAAYFKRRSVQCVPSILYIDASPHISRLYQLEENVYEIVFHGKPEKGSEILNSVFESVDFVTFRVRKTPYYTGNIIADIRSPDIPSFILGKRLIYACATHRIASDFEFDLIGARNVASLLKP